MEKIRMDVPVHYKTFKGWDGKRYKVRMTPDEIREKNTLGILFGIILGVPLFIMIAAKCAGLI